MGEPGAVAVHRVSACPCCPPLPPTQWGAVHAGRPPAGINPLVPVCCQVPQRTSPTGPKNTPNPARLGNVPSGILRKNSPAARNGGTEADAQILELNQQVGRGSLPDPRAGGHRGTGGLKVSAISLSHS